MSFSFKLVSLSIYIVVLPKIKKKIICKYSNFRSIKIFLVILRSNEFKTLFNKR